MYLPTNHVHTHTRMMLNIGDGTYLSTYLPYLSPYLPYFSPYLTYLTPYLPMMALIYLPTYLPMYTHTRMALTYLPTYLVHTHTRIGAGI